MEGWTDLVPRTVLRVGCILFTIVWVSVFSVVLGFTASGTTAVQVAIALASFVLVFVGFAVGTFASCAIWIEGLGYVPLAQRRRQQARALKREQRRQRRRNYRLRKEQGRPELPPQMSRIEALEQELGITDQP